MYKEPAILFVKTNDSFVIGIKNFLLARSHHSGIFCNHKLFSKQQCKYILNTNFFIQTPYNEITL